MMSWGCSDRVRIPSAKAGHWLDRQLPEVITFSPQADTPLLEREGGDSRHVIYRFGGTQLRGLLRLDGGEWVYARAFSSHGSGDLILALDSRGRLYACNGHVCPHLVLDFGRDSPPERMTLEAFRRARVPLSTGESGSPYWQPVEEWRRRAGTAVQHESEDALVAAARGLKPGDSMEEVLRRLGYMDGATGSPTRHGCFWKAGGSALHVYFLHGEKAGLVEVSLERAGGASTRLVPQTP